MMSAALMLLAALPMGDNTPVLLYAVVGIVAVLLVIACVILGKKTKK